MATRYSRARGNDGGMFHTERATPVRMSLLYSVLPPQPLERKAPQVFHGPKKATSAKRGRLTDAEFLRIRSLYKFTSMTRDAIAEEVGATRTEVDGVLSHLTRVHLEPAPEHAGRAA